MAESKIMMIGWTFLTARKRQMPKRTADTQKLRVFTLPRTKPEGKNTAVANERTAAPMSPTPPGLSPFMQPPMILLFLKVI